MRSQVANMTPGRLFICISVYDWRCANWQKCRRFFRRNHGITEQLNSAWNCYSISVVLSPSSAPPYIAIWGDLIPHISYCISINDDATAHTYPRQREGWRFLERTHFVWMHAHPHIKCSRLFLSVSYAPSSSLPPFGRRCRPVHNPSLVCCHMGMNSDTTSSSRYDRSNSLPGYRHHAASIVHGGKEMN